MSHLPQIFQITQDFCFSVTRLSLIVPDAVQCEVQQCILKFLGCVEDAQVISVDTDGQLRTFSVLLWINFQIRIVESEHRMFFVHAKCTDQYIGAGIALNRDALGCKLPLKCILELSHQTDVIIVDQHIDRLLRTDSLPLAVVVVIVHTSKFLIRTNTIQSRLPKADSKLLKGSPSPL